jgi:DnaJ-domain-containing protein 1
MNAPPIPLGERLLDLLRAHPGGMSEFELIAALDDPAINREALADTLSLFQTHFLLFHHLYRLQERLRRERAGRLEIHCLKIILHPFTPGSGQLPAGSDPLGDYYLDLDNLASTGKEEVEELLAAFWERFVGQDELSEALRTLGLEDAADFPAIRRRYRELAMRHHPDRGGDTEILQALNAAMAVLARHHRRED